MEKGNEGMREEERKKQKERQTDRQRDIVYPWHSAILETSAHRIHEDLLSSLREMVGASVLGSAFFSVPGLRTPTVQGPVENVA